MGGDGLLTGVCVVGVFFFGMLILIVVAKTIQKKEEKEEQEYQLKIAFYKACVNEGILSLKSEKDIQKATLIAQSKGLVDIPDINSLFAESEMLATEKEEDQRENALEDKRQEELQACNKLERYSGYTGRDKRIAMLCDLRNEALSGADALVSATTALVGATQQKEIDWATYGGIASGIAGPAAGVATALDIQAKNAEIRAQNKANINNLSSVITTSFDSAEKLQKEAERLAREIEATRIKLVEDNDPSDYLSSIEFSDSKVEVSETGTCTVHTTAKLSEPYMIFDDVKASIDGVINADIYDDDNLIGSAEMVLPLYGVYTSSVDLVGMALYCADPDKEYTVKFSVSKLWAIER